MKETPSPFSQGRTEWRGDSEITTSGVHGPSRSHTSSVLSLWSSLDSSKEMRSME